MSARVFDFDHAIVREPAPSVVKALSASGQSADYDGVVAEHRAYVDALRGAGLEVDILPPLADHPDSLFVEDPAVVLHEGAILLKPGAPSRMDEAEAIAPDLERHFGQVLALDEGCADGGDILVLPDEILIGRSSRTDRLGAKRFCELMRDLGRKVRIVDTPESTLHLKSDCALLDEQTIIATPALAGSGLFPGFEVIETPAGEAPAANLVRVNDRVLAGDYPRTLELLTKRGYDVVALPVKQIARIDAGLSCMSLRWRAGS